jgi:sensor domain CHASE-containing protein/nitrogen-specific signal transduction histidine kinase
MKMLNKVLIIVAALTTAVFLALYVTASIVIMPSFATLENQKTGESVLRATNLISNEVADISSRVSDWAFWDDTYDFVQTGNQTYISLNLNNSTFVYLRLNLMLLINTSGDLVYGRVFDLDNNTEMAVPQGVAKEILSKPALWNFTSTDSRMEGIILLSREPMIFSSKPILTSLEEGPIRGALIMGRYIDINEISFLSSTLKLSVTVVRFDDPQVQKDFQIARSSLQNTAQIFVEPMNADYVGGYRLINDVFSNPALILRIDLPRDIYKQGLTAVNNLTVLIAGICAIFGVAIIIFLDKGMLSPLLKLTKTVKEIGTIQNSMHTHSRLETDETSILTAAVQDTISKRMAAIEELAGMVGHDLRNPLTGINAAAYYIRKKYGSKMDARGIEMLRIIEDDVSYSNKIVNDLLEYSRKIQLRYVDTTTKTLVKEALSLVSIPENIKLIDLTENEIEIAVDSDKMKRVFVNLINNAIEAMPKGGSLTIKSTRVADGVKITFSDTGCGMSKETLNKICTPLFTTKAKGMGFGLSISKRVVEAHGGSLSFESTVGKGTTTTVFIKTKPNVETSDEIWLELPPSTQSATKHRAGA